MLGVDLMGPFRSSASRNQYMLVFEDCYTCWTELFPLRKATAETISIILIRDIFSWWEHQFTFCQTSVPCLYLLCDTCEWWNLQRRKTSPYHPQTNLTERINSNIKAMIASYVEEKHKTWFSCARIPCLPCSPPSLNPGSWAITNIPYSQGIGRT